MDDAEVDAALEILERTAKPGSTVGADKNYDQKRFVQRVRELKVTLHVAQKRKGSAIDGRTTRHPEYAGPTHETEKIVRVRREVAPIMVSPRKGK